jgi:hypothetical protein
MQLFLRYLPGQPRTTPFNMARLPSHLGKLCARRELPRTSST